MHLAEEAVGRYAVTAVYGDLEGERAGHGVKLNGLIPLRMQALANSTGAVACTACEPGHYCERETQIPCGQVIALNPRIAMIFSDAI